MEPKEHFIDKISLPEIVTQKDLIKHYKCGRQILKKGDNAKYVYYICSGKINVYNETADGNIGRVVCAQSGETVGEMEILADEPITVFSASIHEDATVIRMEKQDFLNWMKEDPEFCMSLAKVLARKLSNTAHTFCEHTTQSALSLVKNFIIDSVQGKLKESQKAKVKNSRVEIADDCGISERTVNRCVGKLKEQGLICLEKGKITVNKNQLEHLKTDNQDADCENL